MCANFGDPRSRDRELTHKKHKKKIFALKDINLFVTQKPLDVQS